MQTWALLAGFLQGLLGLKVMSHRPPSLFTLQSCQVILLALCCVTPVGTPGLLCHYRERRDRDLTPRVTQWVPRGCCASAVTGGTGNWHLG